MLHSTVHAMLCILAGLRRQRKRYIPHSSVGLLNQLREQSRKEKNDARKQLINDKKAQQEAVLQEYVTWENTMMEDGLEYMKAMWEVETLDIHLFYKVCSFFSIK